MSQTPKFGRDRLPDALKRDVDFSESSIFKIADRQLPNPSTIDTSGAQDIATFPELQLDVKYGRRVTVDEAISIWVVKKYFGGQVPVPEPYGWRVRQDHVFIYMELVPGMTLEQRWSDPDFKEKDEATVREQLNRILALLHQLPHESHNTFVGSILRGPLIDRVFYELPPAGPFNNLEQFYIWMEFPQRLLNPSQRYTDPYLESMPRDSAIVFSHADMHPKNIMVSASGLPHILAIVDWGQSGWYPDWWEYFKMCYTTHWERDWRNNWIPKIVEARKVEQYLMAEYTISIGAV